MEAVVATAISVIAILGLAHSFGMGRAFIDRYAIARVALGVAQARMEGLSMLPPAAPDFSIGPHPDAPVVFTFQGAPVGTEQWLVEWFDDPSTPLTTADLRRVTVVVAWSLGADQDSVRLARLFQD